MASFRMSREAIPAEREPFACCRMKTLSPDCRRLVASGIPLMIGGLFACAVVFVLFSGIWTVGFEEIIIAAVLGITALILFLIFRGFKPVDFDSSARVVRFYDGAQVAFEEIETLQVVGDKYGMFQLNLVERSRKRRLLIPKGTAKNVRRIADELSVVLSVPVIDWDRNPRPFADSVPVSADQIAWSPLKPGGTSVRTYKLVRTASGDYVFRVSFGRSFASLAIFMAGGAAGLLYGLYLLVIRWSPEGLFLILWGTLFGFPLWWWLMLFLRRPVFDFRSRAYWRGRCNLRRLPDRRKLRDYTPFSEIAALQIVEERLHSQKGGSYSSYELNMILKNGTRRNVVDHGDGVRLRQDAEVLAKSLSVPLYEAGALAPELPH